MNHHFTMSQKFSKAKSIWYPMISKYPRNLYLSLIL